ncbi:YbaB/EbfC family nucleoid-associated protein [Streptosporangium sp. KLBMP 9127]|nr:YbaB/EbfC family nucleoid-associated protein [Streptosporangium sp. KLBMP 9127]
MEEADELRALMAALPEIAARNEAIVAEWSERTFTGSAAKGAVVATVDPAGSLLGLDISPLGMRRLGRAELAEAVVSAVHGAEAAAAAAKDEMLGSLRVGNGPSLGALMAESRRDLADRTGFAT